MQDQDRQLEKVIGALRQRRQQKTSLSNWLFVRHAALASEFLAARPRWEDLAAELASIGVVDARGKAPTGDTLRKAWSRVCQNVEAMHRKSTLPIAAPATAVVRPAQPGTSSASTPVLDGGEEDFVLTDIRGNRV
jgi:hypothetical protein